MVDEARALLIKKLLNKAEARGVTDAERDAYNAKATALMIQWGIEEAMLIDADRTTTEKIVQRVFTTDAPKSYSFEMSKIGVQIANALGCQGLMQKQRDGRTDCVIVGFESDVERVGQLYASIARQCSLALGAWYARLHTATLSGTDKFNAKRSFITGFAASIGAKLKAVKEQVVASAEPGTDLVLIDRSAAVTKYIQDEMRTSMSRPRRYTPSGYGAGHAAGLKADIGGTKINGG
jgi:hypothetical protein